VTGSGAPACAHFRVRGHVQGVFYRASTETVALRLGLSGWVRNSENGDVELVACGGAQKLDELERWLWQGPAGARVSAVQRSAAPLQVYRGFAVRH